MALMKMSTYAGGGGAVDISDIKDVQMNVQISGASATCLYVVGIKSIKMKCANSIMYAYDSSALGNDHKIATAAANTYYTFDVSSYNAIWLLANSNGNFTSNITVLS